MPTALIRDVSASLARCELTHLEREPIDVARARLQHEAYERTLIGLGCRIVRLPAADELPDAVFVEDTALALDEAAVLTRPGAPSRRPECDSVAAALEPFLPVVRMRGPGTLDGGDVLRVDRTLYVGLSTRTDRAGIAELESLLAPYGYAVRAVPLIGCLHLKTAVTQVAPRALLINRNWVDPATFDRYDLIDVDPAEPMAANALLVGDRLVYPAAFPRTADRLRSHGVAVVTVDLSEVAKAEGGVTCCSILLNGA